MSPSSLFKALSFCVAFKFAYASAASTVFYGPSISLYEERRYVCTTEYILETLINGFNATSARSFDVGRCCCAHTKVWHRIKADPIQFKAFETGRIYMPKLSAHISDVIDNVYFKVVSSNIFPVKNYTLTQA